jgi:hypothetical protein
MMNQQQITTVASLCIKHQITDVRDFFKDLAAWDSTKLQKEWGKPASVPTIVWLAQNCKASHEKQMLQALAKLEIERDVLFKHVGKIDSEITTQIKAATAKPSLSQSLAKNRFAPAVVSTSTSKSEVQKPKDTKQFQTFEEFLQDPTKLAFVFEPVANTNNIISYNSNAHTVSVPVCKPTSQPAKEFQIYKRLSACDSEFWQIHDQLLNQEATKEVKSGNKRARSTNEVASTKASTKVDGINQSFVKKWKANHSFVK